MTATLKRRIVFSKQQAGLTLDSREKDICKRIIEVFQEFWTSVPSNPSKHVVDAFTRTFDQSAVARHIESQHSYAPQELFASLRELSEISYEGRSIPLGVLVDTRQGGQAGSGKLSLEQLLREKKYQALTDGYNTAYQVNRSGTIFGILDLERSSERESGRGRRFYPEWSSQMALSCTSARIGFSLTRQGDILYFEDGTLRMTYRSGHWRYWNHLHVLEILLHATRTRHVLPTKRQRILRKMYRRALDLSFRRTGGLLVLLGSRKTLSRIVRKGDAIGDSRRRSVEKVLDTYLSSESILGIPSHVLVDIASLDGAVVFANSGQILAYGAVLDPRRTSGIRHGQGSRTKAAIGASHYGLAAKISSDGDITFYRKGKALLSI